MDYKVVCIKIPTDQELPIEMEDFTPEETLLVNTIGTNAMVSIKKQLINKENTEYIVKMKADLEEEYSKQLTEKEQTILSLEMQTEIERNVLTRFIEIEKGQIERNAMHQYNTIVELKKDELEKVKQELYEKKKEMERLRDEKEREINLQKDILREEIHNKTLEVEKIKNEIEIMFMKKTAEQEECRREELEETKRQMNLCMMENEKYKNEILQLENKHNTEFKVILLENEKVIEKKHQEEIEEHKRQMNHCMTENEKYKNEIIELENKHTTEVKMILMENQMNIEKKYQEEMEETKRQMNLYMMENEKYKNEILQLENKHNTEFRVILMENEKNIEKKHQEELEEHIKRMNASMMETEKYKNEMRELENKHNTELKITFMENEKKHQEEMQKLEAERTRLDELLKHNEQNWALKVQHDVMNEKHKETEKRDLLTIENNVLREKIQVHELSIEKLKNEMLMKQMDETKRNNIPANIGNDGEQIFYNLAKETFCDFDDFKIENVSKNGGHQGDFIMSFAKFDIMVDVKNYTCSVGSSERQKIKKDLEKCPHIKIAWLVSLQTKIDKFGKYPIMCEMVNNSCVFYVNSLLLKSDPQETLKSLWCSTETLFDVILNRNNESLEVEMIKKNEIRIYKICGEMMKSVKEGKQTLNLLKTNNEKIEASLQEILKEGISDLRENATDDIVKWCNLKIIPAQNQKTSVSAMFEKFKTDCPDCNVSLDSFRLIVKTIYNVKSNSFKVISNISFIQTDI